MSADPLMKEVNTIYKTPAYEIDNWSYQRQLQEEKWRIKWE